MTSHENKEFSTNSIYNAGVIKLIYLHNHSYFTYNTGYLYRKYNYSLQLLTIWATYTTYIPLTNRVRGPYHKLRTKFFPLPFMAQARSVRAINRRGKNEDP